MKNRIDQVNKLIRQELGQIILREVDMPEGVVVTLTRVAASGNLQQDIYSIQQMLNSRLKMRPVPRIRWVAETATAEAQKIEELLDQIKKER